MGWHRTAAEVRACWQADRAGSTESDVPGGTAEQPRVPPPVESQPPEPDAAIGESVDPATLGVPCPHCAVGWHGVESEVGWCADAASGLVDFELAAKELGQPPVDQLGTPRPVRTTPSPATALSNFATAPEVDPERLLATLGEQHLAFEEALTEVIRARLTPRKQDILGRRLGLGGERFETLEEIGSDYNLTRERIRQLEQKSIAALRAMPKTALHDMVGSLNSSEKAMVLAAFTWLPEQRLSSALRLLLFLDGLAFKEAGARGREIVANFGLPDLPAVELLDSLEAGVEVPRMLDPSFVAWPGGQSHQVTLAVSRPVRQPRGDLAGTFDSAKLGRAVAFESGLERRLMVRLEGAENVSSYLEQPLEIGLPDWHPDDYDRFTPDILVEFSDGGLAIVEVKPLLTLPLARNLVRAAAMAQWAADRHIGMFFGHHGRIGVADLLYDPVPEGFRRDVLAAVDRDTLNWSAYDAIRARHDIGLRAFAALVVQEKLITTRQPFSLRRPTASELSALAMLDLYRG